MMRYLHLFILLLLPACTDAHANLNFFLMTNSTPPAEEGGDCPSGTYAYYWDGDHSTSNLTGCTNSGAGTFTFTQNGGSITTSGCEASEGNCFVATGANQYLQLTSPTINETTGTMWMRLYVDDAYGDRSDSLYFWETIRAGSPNTDKMTCVMLTTAETVRCIWEGNNAVQNVNGTGFTSQAWQWVGYSWDNSGTDKHSVYDGASWTENVEALTAFSATLDEMTLGEDEAGGGSNEGFKIDRYSLISGTYQAANPGDD